MTKNNLKLSTLDSQFVEYFNEIKSEGELYTSVSTPHGLVDLLAEIEIVDEGATLHLKDIVIYPRGKPNLKGLVYREMLKIKTDLLTASYRLGFKNLKITGRRHEHSTSKNTGHLVEIFIDLITHFKERK